MCAYVCERQRYREREAERDTHRKRETERERHTENLSCIVWYDYRGPDDISMPSSKWNHMETVGLIYSDVKVLRTKSLISPRSLDLTLGNWEDGAAT